MINQSLRPAALTGATPTATISDPRIRRWYADLMADRRLVCEHDGARWIVAVDGRRLADEHAFEAAVHSAYAMTRALSALDRARAA
ncbi:hypothetical protein BCh11DRAFT_00949 [Burkholderia sp. Ch1-1]|uniref:Uncharacterized protein n=1 Tax=Paraburkholderia dioscoreae TaxID=2604047 RepID=A0A5Q4YVJ8_9BURK|nr:MULTISPECIES: hypothetical protein [Paraburkholderia]EIF33185.1 hypothetical protein BCh11DRAFT_00949 [Burkholderia sp. Ch1-1]MDR8399952.1 hypothetical protein [Paraburkholderia sp. USG1]VVD32005.1 conserved protein of unknown function [Paraburkholderia dioscoreae]